MSIMKRMSMVFRTKANKALDRAEDPRETLDYSYQRQLELLQKVRRGVADVATSRKRLELQMNQLTAQQSDKLQGQAQAALAAEPRGPGAGGADSRKSRAWANQLSDVAAASTEGLQAQEEKLTHGQRSGCRPRSTSFRTQQGDDQGHLHRGRGADEDR